MINVQRKTLSHLAKRLYNITSSSSSYSIPSLGRSGAALQTPHLLGLDVGSTFVGVAVSNINNTVAEPLTTLYRRKPSSSVTAKPHATIPISIRSTASNLQALIDQHHIIGLVVGYPTPDPGQAAQQSKTVKDIEKFMKALKMEGNIKTEIFYYNEAFTTVTAREISKRKKGGKKTIKKKEDLDMISACLILNGFLKDLAHYSDEIK